MERNFICSLSSSLRLIDKMTWTDQDQCQRIDTGLKDVDEVGGDDANATQLGIDGGHEDAEHPSPIQVLQRCNEPRFFLLPLHLPGQVKR